MQFKDFDEAASSGRPFYQLCYYDRRETSSDRLRLYYSTKHEVEKVVAKMEKTNKELFKKMLEVYKPYGVTEENYKDYMIWNLLTRKVDFETLTPLEKRLFRYDENNVGFCHITCFRRDLKEEEREEEERMKVQRYEEQGPFGGAFKDWDDYYRWKER